MLDHCSAGPQAAAPFILPNSAKFAPNNGRGRGRYKQRGHSGPYWELEQRLGGEADDMVRLPSGWVAVKNRDTLVASEESGGLSASTRSVHCWPPLPQHASARTWTGTSLSAAPPLTPNLFSCCDPLFPGDLPGPRPSGSPPRRNLGPKPALSSRAFAPSCRRSTLSSPVTSRPRGHPRRSPTSTPRPPKWMVSATSVHAQKQLPFCFQR